LRQIKVILYQVLSQEMDQKYIFLIETHERHCEGWKEKGVNKFDKQQDLFF